MGETITRTATAKLMKKAFLEALQSNDYRTLEELLAQKQIDVDTVFEVEDENLLLASYKQGKKPWQCFSCKILKEVNYCVL